MFWRGINFCWKRAVSTSKVNLEYQDGIYCGPVRSKPCTSKTAGKPCTTPIIDTNCLYDMNFLKPGTTQPSIIIIGAGMAGLSAAHRLTQAGITNFRVLEASDRPGGRVRSCWLGDTVIELGAESVSGANISNPVYTLAAQDRLIEPPLVRDSETPGIFFTSDGRAIDPRTANKAATTYKTLKSKGVNLVYSKKGVPKESLNDYLEKKIRDELTKMNETERFDAARVFYGLNNELKSRVGADLKDVSASALGNLHDLPGGSVRIPLGMGSLVAPLIRDLPECSLVFCKPVHCIRWGTAAMRTPRAVVKCCDGEEFPADYVIVTVPLGVLKEKADSMFCPNLPACKMEAINKVGFGHVDKIFMEVRNPFWVGSDAKFNFAWSPYELQIGRDWASGLTGVSSLFGSSKVLVATISGPQAKEMELQADTKIVCDLLKTMKSFIGDFMTPPKEIVKTDWSTNPLFLGAFTYLRIGSSEGHIRLLSEPLPGVCDDIPPIILFAGEHTSPSFYSTLQGARESGIREADRILHLTKAIKGPPIETKCIPCVTE